MSRWGRSRELTRTTYQLVHENPGMRRWTVRAALHGAVVGGVVVGVGAAIAAVGAAEVTGALDAVAVVTGTLVVLAGLVAGLTAANVQLAALVAVADDVLHGRDPDEAAALATARSRRGPLTGWSAISVAVGALVSLIRGDGDSGLVATIVRSVLAGLVAAVWGAVTTLVMPVIVLEGRGAVPAVRRSASLIRTTWGEAVLGSVRIGARMALTFVLPGLLLLVGGILLGVAVGGPAIVAGLVAALVGVVLIVIGAVRAATCRNVFGVALYRWATGDGALGPFSDEDLRGAVEVRRGPAPVAS